MFWLVLICFHDVLAGFRNVLVGFQNVLYSLELFLLCWQVLECLDSFWRVLKYFGGYLEYFD